LNLDSTTLNQRLKNIKLVVCDVDGTLTNDKEKIGDLTREYLAKIKQIGVTFTLSTQKIRSSVIELAKELNIDVPFITANGKLISDCMGNILLASYLKPRQVKKALKLTKYYNAKIAFCNNDEIIYTKENAMVKDLKHRMGTNYKLVDNYIDHIHDVVEIIIVGYDRKVIKYIHKKMKFPLAIFVKSVYFRLSSSSGMYNLDIRRTGIDKQSSLKKLAKHLNFSKNEVAVIGDWYNDMELFKYGGLNIALKNAVPRLRYLADYVVPKTNNEDGVGEFLKMIYEIKTSKV
jgi:Cof subfamily protein (haloacid dehalogenase superfamily)